MKKKSPYFPVKAEYGGGVTSDEEIVAELRRYEAAGYLKRTIKDGHEAWIETEKTKQARENGEELPNL